MPCFAIAPGEPRCGDFLRFGVVCKGVNWQIEAVAECFGCTGTDDLALSALFATRLWEDVGAKLLAGLRGVWFEFFELFDELVHALG